MNITTKFKLGDTVWSTDKGEVKVLEINGITTETEGDAGSGTHTTIYYNCKEDGLRLPNFYKEEYLFSSLSELQASIAKIKEA